MIKSIHYVSKCDVMPVRSVLFSMFVVMAAAASARTILVPAQPVSEFADTEVSTNIVLHASRTGCVLEQIASLPVACTEVRAVEGREASLLPDGKKSAWGQKVMF